MRNQVGTETGSGRVYVYSLLVPFPLAFLATIAIAHPAGRLRWVAWAPCRRRRTDRSDLDYCAPLDALQAKLQSR